MTFKENDFVKINYTGRIKDTGEIFDTTYPSVAKEEGLQDENVDYDHFHPMTTIIGSGYFIAGFEEKIKELNIGDKEVIEVTSQKNPDLIRQVSIDEFKKQGVTPEVGDIIPGEPVDGIITAVNDDAVEIDFNSKIAGKELIFDVEVLELIDDDIDKIKSLIELNLQSVGCDMDKVEITIDDDIVKIVLDEIIERSSIPIYHVTVDKVAITDAIRHYFNNIKEVQFIEKYH